MGTTISHMYYLFIYNCILFVLSQACLWISYELNYKEKAYFLWWSIEEILVFISLQLKKLPLCVNHTALPLPPEEPNPMLCSHLLSQQQSGWNTGMWWSESSSIKDQHCSYSHSKAASIPILAQTRQIGSIGISAASTKKQTQPTMWSGGLRLQHIELRGGSYLGKLRFRISLTASYILWPLPGTNSFPWGIVKMT